jgi:hypothetical protein
VVGEYAVVGVEGVDVPEAARQIERQKGSEDDSQEAQAAKVGRGEETHEGVRRERPFLGFRPVETHERDTYPTLVRGGKRAFRARRRGMGLSTCGGSPRIARPPRVGWCGACPATDFLREMER